VRLRRGTWLRCVIIAFAERTAGTPAKEPRVDADGVEGVAACQASHIVVILQGIDADSACISRRAIPFLRHRSRDMLLVIIIIVVIIGCCALSGVLGVWRLWLSGSIRRLAKFVVGLWFFLLLCACGIRRWLGFLLLLFVLLMITAAGQIWFRGLGRLGGSLLIGGGTIF
jgi:hypothetical protein